MLGMLQMISLPQSSTMAPEVDGLFNFLYWFSILSLIGVTAATAYFVMKYRRRHNDEKTPYIEGHTPSEMAVALGLFVLVMVIFAWGWIDYKKMIQTPDNAMEINVMGKQWLWEFEYTNGRKMTNELVVPLGQPVELLMSSADVLHSFYIPDFRVKQDVVPGTYTRLWFEATQTGEFHVFCAEYCGTAHSKMMATLKVVPKADFARWQTRWELEQRLGQAPKAPAAPTEEAPGDQPSEAPAAEPTQGAAVSTISERGKRAFAEKGCTACHSVDGTTMIGPPLNGLFEHERELADGSKVKADENYLRESLMDPQAKMVKGFQPMMPTFRGTLSDDDVNALVAYIKSLKN